MDPSFRSTWSTLGSIFSDPMSLDPGPKKLNESGSRLGMTGDPGPDQELLDPTQIRGSGPIR